MFKLYKKVNMLFAIFIVLFSLISCKSYVPVSNDINAIEESVTEENIVENKYIINIRSGKVHTYSHGIKIIENKDNIKESSESLDAILQNEKYDICHTCYAGLLIDDKINKYDINLIEKYMRLYEFSQIEPARAEFLISIFTVGDWYVNNVRSR